MIRSICERLWVLTNAHPDTKIRLTKFGSLRPRWAKSVPQHNLSVCIYYAKAELCIAGLENASGRPVNIANLEYMCICSQPTNGCLLGY